jgi:hypothetical protein
MQVISRYFPEKKFQVFEIKRYFLSLFVVIGGRALEKAIDMRDVLNTVCEAY